MASTVNQSAFNLGNATGAFVGGAVIHLVLAYQVLRWRVHQ
jgi:DHA1 family inner membrane transport protein